MEKSEIDKRFLLYLKNHTTDVTPPDCEECNEVATIYDTLAGENYCERCLKKSLIKDISELKEHTDEYMGN